MIINKSPLKNYEDSLLAYAFFEWSWLHFRYDATLGAGAQRWDTVVPLGSLPACTGTCTQRGKLYMEVWTVSSKGTKGKWLIYRRERKSWSGNGSLIREKSSGDPRILKVQSCPAFSHHISETMHFRITGANTHSNTLNPNHFCYWDLVSDDTIFVYRCKNKYNMCLAFSCSFSLLKNI